MIFFLFSLPDSWVWEGIYIYLFNYFVILEGGSLSIFTHHYRRRLHRKASVKALIKNGIISQRIERENVFWLACLFVCFSCLLFSPVHV